MSKYRLTVAWSIAATSARVKNSFSVVGEVFTSPMLGGFAALRAFSFRMASYATSGDMPPAHSLRNSMPSSSTFWAFSSGWAAPIGF